MVYPLSVSKSKKLKRFINPTILSGLLIFLFILVIYLYFSLISILLIQ